MTNLVRGVDFVVPRRIVGPGRCVRNLWITECGLHRLVSRDYKTFTDNPPQWKRKLRITPSEFA